MEDNAFTMFDVLVWAGTAVTLSGLGLLVWCILRVARARRQATDDSALRDALQRIVPLNLGALFLSVMGLMLVIVGIILR